MAVVRRFVALAVALGIAALAACGGDDPPPGPAACDSSKCFQGNTCLAYNGVTECRKTCASNDDPATSCPLGYLCADTDPAAGISPFCVKNTAAYGDPESRTPVVAKDNGQWGTPCPANEGADNPACDGAQGFYCYGISPTDGNAYCTSFGCEKDTDCGAGFGCETVNGYPNTNTAKRKQFGPGATQKACIRRGWCSACTSDIDCPAIAGVKQHCLEDANGRLFCSAECNSTQGCPTEAKCVTVALADESQVKVCYPRSKLCIGDGSLCQPCLSDADCGDDGVCARGEYTTERFCAKAAPGGDCKQCPKTVTGIKDKSIGCTSKDGEKLPKGYCTGLFSINGVDGADIGCFTPDR